MKLITLNPCRFSLLLLFPLSSSLFSFISILHFRVTFPEHNQRQREKESCLSIKGEDQGRSSMQKHTDTFLNSSLGMRMRCFLFLLLLLFLNLCFHGFSQPLNNNNKPLPLPPPALLVGTVFCDTCFHQRPSKSPHFISGATVAVECRDEKSSTTTFQQRATTNRRGKFRVVLPFSVAKHVRKIESCSVKLIKSSEPFCSVASSATSSSLNFKNSKNKNGVRIFSAGFFTFKPLQQPAFCTQNTNVFKSSQINPQFLFPPLVPPVIQPPSFLPPNPLQPAPLIPNPFQPPAPVIPNPFQPPAPVIPNPFQPPPGPVIPLPPLPFFTPPPPPPTLLPPSLVPPFLPPLPPIPGIPSGPPREETSSPVKHSP